ncbi:MAG TPA: hypothetical protein VIJ14_01045, partial [Rhabdochlamydiaceae bacterium]
MSDSYRPVGCLEVVLHYPQNDFVSLLGYYSQKKSAKRAIFFNFAFPDTSHEPILNRGNSCLFPYDQLSLKGMMQSLADQLAQCTSVKEKLELLSNFSPVK